MLQCHQRLTKFITFYASTIKQNNANSLQIYDNFYLTSSKLHTLHSFMSYRPNSSNFTLNSLFFLNSTYHLIYNSSKSALTICRQCIFLFAKRALNYTTILTFAKPKEKSIFFHHFASLSLLLCAIWQYVNVTANAKLKKKNYTKKI